MLQSRARPVRRRSGRRGRAVLRRLPCTTGAAPFGRWAIITVDGSTATTSTVGRLVRAGAGPDVDDRPSLAECGGDVRFDPRDQGAAGRRSRCRCCRRRVPSARSSARHPGPAAGPATTGAARWPTRRRVVAARSSSSSVRVEGREVARGPRRGGGRRGRGCGAALAREGRCPTRRSPRTPSYPSPLPPPVTTRPSGRSPGPSVVRPAVVLEPGERRAARRQGSTTTSPMRRGDPARVTASTRPSPSIASPSASS